MLLTFVPHLSVTKTLASAPLQRPLMPCIVSGLVCVGSDVWRCWPYNHKHSLSYKKPMDGVEKIILTIFSYFIFSPPIFKYRTAHWSYFAFNCFKYTMYTYSWLLSIFSIL